MYFAKNNFRLKIKIYYLQKQYLSGSIAIKRYDLLKEILAKEKKNKVITDNLKIFKDRFTIIDTIEKIYLCFYIAIMGDNTKLLDDFIY